MGKAVQRALHLERADSPLADTLMSGTTNVEVAHGNLATVRAVEQGRRASEAATVGSDIEQTELLRSAVYLVKMKGEFTPAVPMPHGGIAPHGTVLSLILDAHTGFMMGLQLGGNPDLAGLGTVTKFRIGTGTRTAVTGRFDPADGLLLGSLYGPSGKPAGGSRVMVTSGHRHTLVTTTSKAGFALHLPAGRYAVAALRSDGTRCVERTERISRHHDSFAALECNR
jgi:hypothetical protein